MGLSVNTEEIEVIEISKNLVKHCHLMLETMQIERVESLTLVSSRASKLDGTISNSLV